MINNDNHDDTHVNNGDNNNGSKQDDNNVIFLAISNNNDNYNLFDLGIVLDALSFLRYTAAVNAQWAKRMGHRPSFISGSQAEFSLVLWVNYTIW